MEQYYASFLYITRRIGYIFDALVHSLYIKNFLDPQDTEAWIYHHNLRFNFNRAFRPRIISDASTSEKMYLEEYEIPFG